MTPHIQHDELRSLSSVYDRQSTAGTRNWIYCWDRADSWLGPRFGVPTSKHFSDVDLVCWCSSFPPATRAIEIHRLARILIDVDKTNPNEDFFSFQAATASSSAQKVCFPFGTWTLRRTSKIFNMLGRAGSGWYANIVVDAGGNFAICIVNGWVGEK